MIGALSPFPSIRLLKTAFNKKKGYFSPYIYDTATTGDCTSTRQRGRKVHVLLCHTARDWAAGEYGVTELLTGRLPEGSEEKGEISDTG